MLSAQIFFLLFRSDILPNPGVQYLKVATSIVRVPLLETFCLFLSAKPTALEVVESIYGTNSGPPEHVEPYT